MATKKKVAKKGNSTARAWEIGGAVTAATLAAAAGAYMLADKKTKAKAKKWASDTGKKVAHHAKTAKKLGKTEYAHVVKELEKRYGPLEKLTAADVIKAGKDLKGQWEKVKAQGKSLKSNYAPKVKKAIKKKKSAKKARA